MNYLTKTDGDLIEKLQELNLKYDLLKSSYEKDILIKNEIEDKLKKSTSLLSAFKQYSIDLAEQDAEAIHQYIVDSFKSIFKVRAVWISTYDEKKSELIIETSTASPKESEKIFKYLGMAIKRFPTPIDQEKYKMIIESESKVYSSLHEISFGQIPQLAGSAIDRLFNIGWFQGVGLVDKGKLFGTLVIAGYKGQEELDTDVVKIFSDLTSNIMRRKEAESKLQISENLFRQAFTTSPDSISINRSSDCMYVSINSGFTKITGYSDSEIIGKTANDLNIWVVRDDLELFKNELREKGKIENLETQFRMKNGTLKEGMISAAMIELDSIPHILSITRDVTEKKQIDIELKSSEARFRKLIELAPDGILLGSHDGFITGANSKMLNIAGRTNEVMIGSNISLLFSNSELNKVPLRYDLLNKGMSVSSERVVIRPDGAAVPVEMHTTMMPDGSYQSIFHDLTERRKAEAEINNLNTSLEEKVNERTAQLEEANNELQAFAYSVSHDLRTPLRAIDGFSKFVLDDPGSELSPEGERLISLIRSNTGKMDKLITDILSLSRVSRIEHKNSKIDMTKMAFSMFNEVSSSETRAELEFILDPLPESFADPILIKQVWINLISNAIKFSSLKIKPQIKIGGYQESKSNVYYITDNGVGFNSEYSHMLFGVFQRLHKANEFEGTGVGLAIVQRIIQRHGGKVWAESKERNGATFYFSLPIKN